jgi:hypothetical protein
MEKINQWVLLEAKFSKGQVTKVIEAARQRNPSLKTDDDVLNSFMCWGQLSLDEGIAKFKSKLDGLKNDKLSNEFKPYSSMLKTSENDNHSFAPENVDDVFIRMFKKFADYLRVPIEENKIEHIKKIMNKLSVVLLCFVFSLTATAQSYSGGSGTEADPYLISSKANIETLATATNSSSKERIWNGF